MNSAGGESNWTQTISGEGGCMIPRFPGPLEPRFNQTWRPGGLAGSNC
jgi:hypothetical protein